MSKNNKEPKAGIVGRVISVRSRQDASEVIFEIARKGKKNGSMVFVARSSVLCSLVLAAYARNEKLHVELLPGTTESPPPVAALRIGSEPPEAKVKVKAKAKPSVGSEIGPPA